MTSEPPNGLNGKQKVWNVSVTVEKPPPEPPKNLFDCNNEETAEETKNVNLDPAKTSEPDCRSSDKGELTLDRSNPPVERLGLKSRKNLPASILHAASSGSLVAKERRKASSNTGLKGQRQARSG